MKNIANYMVALWLYEKAVVEPVGEFIKSAEDIKLSQESWSKFWQLINMR